MDGKILQLKREVFKTEHPSRELLIVYLKALTTEGGKLPVSERDWFAYEMLRPFIELDLPIEDDPELDYIIFQLVGAELDVNTEDILMMRRQKGDEQKWREFKANTWRELIERVERLR